MSRSLPVFDQEFIETSALIDASLAVEAARAAVVDERIADMEDYYARLAEVEAARKQSQQADREYALGLAGVALTCIAVGVGAIIERHARR